MSNAITNAIARQNARAAPVDVPGRALEESEIIVLRRRLDIVTGEKEAILASNRETRMELNEEIARLRGELAACETRCSASERRCAELEGRLAGAASTPAAPDNTRYEALVAEFSDLRVAHGACSAREEGLRQVIAELRRSNETLAAQVQALMTEEPEEEDDESEESEGGCEIEVSRGADDRIRSLRVRYTK